MIEGFVCKNLYLSYGYDAKSTYWKLLGHCCPLSFGKLPPMLPSLILS